MKIKYLIISLFILGSYSASSTAGEWLVGARAGVAEIDAPNTDPAVMGYVMLGKEIWNLGAADIAFEAEIGASVVDGEYGNQDASFNTAGVYAALRTKGPVYVIGRAGVMRSELDTEVPPSITNPRIEGDDTDVSLGLGVGFKTGGLNWELLFTTYGSGDTDVDAVSIGLLF